MYISRITLLNWKVYATAHFEFPAPTPGKNIVLIGAPNGYGKTSLFEAIVLGVFGREGMHLIARSSFGDSNSGLDTSYKKFLEEALNDEARSSGHNSCSVNLTFIDDGKILEIKRTWHFNDSISSYPLDEEVNIFEDRTHKSIVPIELPKSEKLAWCRKYIAHTFLPHDLATYFLFDGEQMSAVAERDRRDQVKSGIIGLLGIPVLLQLSKHLHTYSETRRRESKHISNETIERLDRECKELISNLEKTKKRLEEITPILSKSKEKRDSLMRELGSLGVSSQARFQEQMENLDQYRKNLEVARERLENLLARDIALALSGFNLRQTLKNRLSRENIRKQWEISKQQGDEKLENFLNTVKQRMATIYPQMHEEQQKTIEQVLRSVWGQLWYPPPENCAESYLHTHLNEIDRENAINRIKEIDKKNISEITGLLTAITDNSNDLERAEEETTRIKQIAPRAGEINNQLQKLNDQINKFSHEIWEKEREKNVFEIEITKKKKELSQQLNQRDQAKPSQRLSARASAVSSMIDEMVEKVVPSQTTAIAKSMTDAYRAMSHKKDFIKRIEIDDKCNVNLLGIKGRNIQDYDLSEGEKQIFTQALISAISSVSGHAFPMVIDTPLGRLDLDHRKNILRHFVERNNQVILLSTNTEVVGSYLKAIESNVQKKYLINYEKIGEFGQSSVSVGYFDDEEMSS